MTIADLSVQLTQGGKKRNAVISDSVVAAIATGISIGFVQVDNSRKVEIIDGIYRLLQYGIDVQAFDPEVSNIAELPIGAGVDKCLIVSPTQSPSEGGVFIDIGEEYDYTRGTISLTTDVGVALQALAEHLKVF